MLFILSKLLAARDSRRQDHVLFIVSDNVFLKYFLKNQTCRRRPTMSPGIVQKGCMEKDFTKQIWFSFSLDKLCQMYVICTITGIY